MNVDLLTQLYDALKDDTERAFVAPPLPRIPKWDWTDYPYIESVDRALEGSEGVIVRAKATAGRSQIFFLPCSDFDHVYKDTWPLLYEHVKDSSTCKEALKETEFFKEMNK
jgi:hypothetical protein